MAATTTPEQQNKQLVRQAVGDIIVASGRQYDRIDDLYAEGFTQHGGPTGDVVGRGEFRAYLEMLHEAFPDLTFEEELCIAEGDLVCSRYTYSGTHDGEFAGVPATGVKVSITGNTVNRIEDGRIVETWPEVDMLGLLRQVGAVPEQSA